MGRSWERLGVENQDRLGGRSNEGIGAGASKHGAQHGQSGVDVPESRTMEGGRRAVCASNGDELRVLGPEHPDTLSSMNNLASTYRNQGRRSIQTRCAA